MNCRDIQENLSAYLDGEVKPQQAEVIRAHLAACPSCRAELEALRRVAAAMKELPELRAPESLHGQIMSRLEAPGETVAPRRPWARILWPVAAALMIAVLLTVFYTPERERSRTVSMARPNEPREIEYAGTRREMMDKAVSPNADRVGSEGKDDSDGGVTRFDGVVRERSSGVPIITAAPPAPSAPTARNDMEASGLKTGAAGKEIEVAAKARPALEPMRNKGAGGRIGGAEPGETLLREGQSRTQQAAPALSVRQQSPDAVQTLGQAEQQVVPIEAAPVWFVAASDPAAAREKVRQMLAENQISIAVAPADRYDSLRAENEMPAAKQPSSGMARSRGDRVVSGKDAKSAAERPTLVVSASARDQVAGILVQSGLRPLVAMDQRSQLQWAAAPEKTEGKIAASQSNVATTVAEDQVLLARRARKELTVPDRLLTLVFVKDTPAERAGLLALPATAPAAPAR